MSRREWYRHPVDFSKQLISLSVIERFGTKGYGHFILFLEEALFQIKDDEAPIMSVLSLHRWATTLNMKQKGVITFLDHLQNEEFLTYSINKNVLTISMPKLAKILDLSWEAKYKKRSKPPKLDEIKLNEPIPKEMKQEKTEVEDSHTSLNFFDRVRSSLSSKDDDKIGNIESLFENKVSKDGPSPSLITEFEKLIDTRFCKSESQKEYGRDFLVSAKKGYKSGTKSHEMRLFYKKREERYKLSRSSPHIRDEEKKSIYEKVKYGKKVSVEEVNSLIDSLYTHFNDNKYVKNEFGIVFRAKKSLLTKGVAILEEELPENSWDDGGVAALMSNANKKHFIDDEDDDNDSELQPQSDVH